MVEMKGNLRRAATVSWRTTLGGVVTGAGILLLGIRVLKDWGYVPPTWVERMGIAGLILVSLGVTLIGINARDHGVTSEMAMGD